MSTKAEALFQNPEEMLKRMELGQGNSLQDLMTNIDTEEGPWEEIPQKESELMSRLRNLVKTHLSGHGISVIVSSIDEDYILVDARQRLQTKIMELSYDKCLELVQNHDKVYSELLKQSRDYYNFINADVTNVADSLVIR